MIEVGPARIMHNVKNIEAMQDCRDETIIEHQNGKGP